VSATRDMGLRLCGVDIMTDDITRSLVENNDNYTIIEMNGAPGLDNYITT
jgi:D-alanine-D-alanine ligase-like ATP-grasp enzyme